jgi:hypothetical protein
MTEIWTPSDDLLKSDPIAELKVVHPFDPPDLAAHGIVLPDTEDDEANAAAAALAIAVISEDEDAAGEGGECDDDDAIDEPDDDGDIDA